MKRTWWGACVCVAVLMGCGHPIRDLANAAKDLIPDETPKGEPSCSAQATTQIALIANLNADSPISAAWDATRPEATSNFSASSWPYLSDGTTVSLQLFFVRTGERTWDWHALVASPNASPAEQGDGALTFDEQGALRADETRMALRLTRAADAADVPLALAWGTPKSAEADGFDGVTSTHEPSRVYSYQQDGHARLDSAECSGH